MKRTRNRADQTLLFSDVRNPFVSLKKKKKKKTFIKDARKKKTPRKSKLLGFNSMFTKTECLKRCASLCNKMQILLTYSPAVRLNMFSREKVWGRAGGGGGNEACAKCLTVNIVPTSSEMPSEMRTAT